MLLVVSRLNRRFLLAFLVVGVAAVSSTGSGASIPAPKLRLPLDLAVTGAIVYIADGERHQILRYDLTSRRLTVFAGTGRSGTAGDGGRAANARLTEPTELLFDGAGNLYFCDVNQGRVRRIDRRGIITTVARVPTAAGIAIDPAGNQIELIQRP